MCAANHLPKGAGRNEAERLSAQVGEMMVHIHQRYAGDTLAILAETGLTMAQLVALNILRYKGAHSVSGIATCLRLSPAATSHLVERLVQGTFVQRTEDPADRRAKRVVITERGADLVERLQVERTREFAAVLARLSPDVRRRFSAVLELVNRELASLPRDNPKVPLKPETKP